MEDKMKKIPVTIITGFLGSGKTTIIRNLVHYLDDTNQKVLYLKNELGFEDLDAELIKDESKSVISEEITIGTLHHAPLGQMSNTLTRIVEKEHPDRIILESAGSEGTADPIALSVLIDQHPLLFRDGFLKVIDVVNFNGYDQLEDYTKDKAKFIDFILLNKIKLVDQARREAVVGYIREYNESAPIIEAPKGIINPELVFGVTMNQSTQPDQIKLYKDHITAVNYLSDKTFDKSKIEAAFEKFPKTVFRVKGFIKTQNGIEVLNGVYKRFEWLPNTEKNKSDQTKLIIVGSQVGQKQDEIFSILDNCQISEDN
jgi:G3E family GTPase